MCPRKRNWQGLLSQDGACSGPHLWALAGILDNGKVPVSILLPLNDGREASLLRPKGRVSQEQTVNFVKVLRCRSSLSVSGDRRKLEGPGGAVNGRRHGQAKAREAAANHLGFVDECIRYGFYVWLL